ncbi:heterokaryon incompatibility protein-domain-containing protein [Annulohypoxylon maeteangense]|uniref:heterokaryon incompatibility protein-domain-containing protein n=1 Tax=Annulohypoxylon maeteangense TaxID=1927788 RepID=UPI0020076E6D|nr:heterokaryon incompatibility protein-domain-containing protein [Annulohypoxylon maeteangense]KAI0880277.1 heterokaryon incompatibility protein-domain-containing protein [Annulohypoxylon maeteangense]
MWLIDTQTLELKEFHAGHIPQYAILSHRWGDSEVSHQQYQNRQFDPNGDGYQKIKGFCYQVASSTDPLVHYAWVDTCCIDNKSSAELSESINSMFKWYGDAIVCYVYLSDVDYQAPDRESQFQQSLWFTRGWTLQEFLAARELLFFSKTWDMLGTRSEFVDILSSITKIPPDYILRRRPLSDASIAQRMSWASHRLTTREEDIAYSLLGIFNVNMPLIYGEGRKAFLRLQEEIIKRSNDDSILAWGYNHRDDDTPDRTGALAKSPYYFAGCHNIIRCEDWEGRSKPRPWEMTSRGLHTHAIVISSFDTKISR